MTTRVCIVEKKIEKDEGTETAFNLNQNGIMCDCDDSTFLCYPQDGECSCGMFKHHVHCACGGISQIG